MQLFVSDTASMQPLNVSSQENRTDKGEATTSARLKVVVEPVTTGPG